MSSDMDEQLATLAREQDRLEAMLSADENWRALGQLEAREARGEALSSVDGAALRARLVDSLKYNRLYQARSKILEAIAILTESAALPSFAIPPSAGIEPEAPAPPTAAAMPAEPPPVENMPEPEDVAEATEPLPVEVHAITAEPTPPLEPAATPPIDPRRPSPRATIHTTPPVPVDAAPAPDSIIASDLLKIRGITPALAAHLQLIGVERASDVAVWTKDDVRRISTALDLDRTISRENWIEQAALIAQKSGQTLAARSLAAAAPPVAVAASQPAIEPSVVEAPPPPKPTQPATVATIVAGAARSIAERIEHLRLQDEAEPAPPPEPIPSASVSLSDDHDWAPLPDEHEPSPDLDPDDDDADAGAAPARHTPATYAAIPSPTEPVDTSNAVGSEAHETLPEPPSSPPPAETPAAIVATAPLQPAIEPEAPPVTASTLPHALEERLTSLEQGVELTASDEYVEPAPSDHALNGSAPRHTTAFPSRPASVVPDIGVTTSDPVPRGPEPPPRIGNEADVEIVRRQPQHYAAATHADATHPPAPTAWAGNPNAPENFDSDDYDAYRGQSEEASVEIVRDDRSTRMRLPGKPRSSQPSQETTAAVRRFLDALKGK